jgi:hypothetical protein
VFVYSIKKKCDFFEKTIIFFANSIMETEDVIWTGMPKRKGTGVLKLQQGTSRYLAVPLQHAMAADTMAISALFIRDSARVSAC